LQGTENERYDVATTGDLGQGKGWQDNRMGGDANRDHNVTDIIQYGELGWKGGVSFPSRTRKKIQRAVGRSYNLKRFLKGVSGIWFKKGGVLVPPHIINWELKRGPG